MKRYFASCVLVVCFISAAYGDAVKILTFDDLPVAPGGQQIPDGYGGLNWSSCSSYAGPNGPPYPICTGFGFDTPGIFSQGYQAAVISSPNIAFNLAGFYEGSVTTISSSTPFMLLSGYFAAASNDGMTITVSAGGKVQTFDVGTGSPVFETFSFGPVYNIDFSASGGTCTQPNCGWYYGMDDLKIATPAVPEPSTFLLLLSGSLCVGGAIRAKLHSQSHKTLNN